tara:strand:+ start:5357 stop:5632 length:276 start_codon:yes stop_codon:yes gene_type:complete
MSIKKTLLIGALVAISGTAYSAQPEAEAKGDFVSGLKRWSVTCNRCHNMRDLTEFNDADWEMVTRHMRIRAGLTGKDERDIVTYLKQSNNR